MEASVLDQEVKKKRLTLDLDPAFQRRLKARAALNGVSMRQYCLSAIERQIHEDEGRENEGRTQGPRPSTSK